MIGSVLRMDDLVDIYIMFFFFKQKTAYEMLRSLVGSEMCIRDRSTGAPTIRTTGAIARPGAAAAKRPSSRPVGHPWDCLLYTSDAADDLLCVDLGGRRIIKKKNPQTPALIRQCSLPCDLI